MKALSSSPSSSSELHQQLSPSPPKPLSGPLFLPRPILSGKFATSLATVLASATPASATPPSLPTPISSTKTPTLCWVGLILPRSEARRVATCVSGLSYESRARFANVIRTCNFTLGVATNQTSDSLGTIHQIPSSKGGDFNSAMFKVLTEMAAAMTNQDTCMDEVLEEPDNPVKKKVLDLVAVAKNFTGIATAFVDYYSKKGSR